MNYNSIHAWQLIRFMCSETGIEANRVLSKDRTIKTVAFRHVLMSFCRHRMKLNYHQIGAVFQRDHTTVLYAVRRTESLLSVQDDLIRRYHEEVSRLYPFFLRFLNRQDHATK